MMQKKNAIVLPAVLALLAIFALPPAAHGHGNNPKLTSGRWPDPKPPGGNRNSNTSNLTGTGQEPDIQEALAAPDPGDVIAMDLTGELNRTRIDVKVRQLTEPDSDADLHVQQYDPGVVRPRADAFDLTDSLEFLTLDVPNRTIVPRVSNNNGAIPSPGALLLFGLAAAAAQRRRRRR